jgi:membrane associated rhomboid family serine protease
MATCYRHPGRETNVSCSNCGRPICPDCMTSTPVGMRCPDCARQRTKVHRAPSGIATGAAPVTLTLIGINVIAYLAELMGGGSSAFEGGGSVIRDFALFGPAVENGEVYRIVTGGFLHAGLIHLGFNMFALYFLGRLLEPSIGTPRFVAIYFASLFGGAFGALLLDPNALTVGASGAIFGIFGATFVIARGRGFDAVASSIGVILLINLALSFGSARISLGGHLGGLAIGVVCALVILAGERGRLGPRHFPAEMAAMIGVALLSVVASLAIA